MKVVATEMGIFGGGRVRPGVVFEVPDGLTAKWFKPVAAGAAEAPAEPADKPRKVKAKLPAEADLA